VNNASDLIFCDAINSWHSWMMNHGTNNLTHTLDFPLYGQLFASKFMAFGWQQDKRLIQIGHGVPVSCECCEEAFELINTKRVKRYDGRV